MTGDVLFLSEADVERAISMPEAIDALAEAFLEYSAGRATVPPRSVVATPGGPFRLMSAVLPSTGLFGVKTLTGTPGKRQAGDTYFVVLLFSGIDGALRAVVSANYLTGLRTGAASGLAARHLARTDARVLGLIGAGFQGWFQVVAMSAVRPLTEVRVFDADPERARQFGDRIERELGIPVSIANEARAAVSGCDLVVTATSATDPVVQGDWLEPGTHVSGVGTNSPGKRELDTTAFSRSTVVVDYLEQACEEAGDLRQALAAGAFGEGGVYADLAALVAGSKPGRTSAEEITLFKSVGMAIQDIATAALVYERAVPNRLGRRASLASA